MVVVVANFGIFEGQQSSIELCFGALRVRWALNDLKGVME